jgi:hypothetical protein
MRELNISDLTYVSFYKSKSGSDAACWRVRLGAEGLKLGAHSELLWLQASCRCCIAVETGVGLMHCDQLSTVSQVCEAYSHTFVAPERRQSAYVSSMP